MPNSPAQRPTRPSDGSATKQRRGLPPQSWWLVILSIIVLNYFVQRLFFVQPSAVTIPYTFFKQQVEAGNVSKITSSGNSIRGTFKTPIVYPPEGAATEGETEKAPAGKPAEAGKSAEAGKPGETGSSGEPGNAGQQGKTGEPGEKPQPVKTDKFTTVRPEFADPGLEHLLTEKGVTINAVGGESSTWVNLLVGFGPTLLLIFAFVWLSRRAAMGAGGPLGLGRSRAKLYSELQQKVTFDDVAGIDEAENELIEIVDFLKNPTNYQRLGGTMPKGVLLVGAPGTGKTLLARAIAGEAGVPFFSLSASEFIEMIVGVGAARVRDLFKQAREAAPSIIFIDELDAIGRARGSSATIGGHDEREQTLNQILTEMDGFDSREGVVVLAATNRADVLDPALLRPGRFDRRIVVQRPDRAGREAILKVHTKNVPLAPDVSLAQIAASTPGLVGAELRNLVNEAALLAARRKGATSVTSQDFTEALEKITLGPARNILLNPADRERTAYHEAGHALVGLLVPGGDRVQRVSIVPRGLSLGATHQLPVDDRTSYAENYLRARITSALGGRAAEQLVYGITTSGAESDLQQVTEIARHMVLRWGMSEKLGPISFTTPQNGDLPAPFQRQPYSESTAELIDAEVHRIVAECHDEADRLLLENRDKLTALAHALLKSESLDEKAIREATGLA